jgi:hypothetical protein
MLELLSKLSNRASSIRQEILEKEANVANTVNAAGNFADRAGKFVGSVGDKLYGAGKFVAKHPAGVATVGLGTVGTISKFRQIKRDMNPAVQQQQEMQQPQYYQGVQG